MELAFESRPLRAICEIELQAKLELGDDMAEILKHRLADLRAATSIGDILVGRPRVVDGTNSKQMELDLCDGQRLIFCANHPNNPVTDTGNLDWTRVSRVKILRIESDNG